MKYHIEQRAWEAMYAFLYSQRGLHTSNEDSLRRFLEAIWYIVRTGCQWRLLPECYGHWRSIHRRFKRWCEMKVWERMMKHLADLDLEYTLLDSTVIRAHACSSGYGGFNSHSQQALGRSKGGFTTKVHAAVDALGNPITFILTPGNRNDITQAEKLTKGITESSVIADKGYDSDDFVRHLEICGNTAVIPPRSKRKNPRDYDTHLYEERYLIECFFGKIKHFRRIFSRFDKAATTFLGILYFVGSLIWLR